MENRIVYSTDPDFCTVCGAKPCVCGRRPPGKKRPQPAPVRLSFSRASKGTGMTLIEGIIMHPRLKEELLRKFKKRLGCGGTIKGGTLELQGDRRDFVQKELEAEGYRIKRVGG